MSILKLIGGVLKDLFCPPFARTGANLDAGADGRIASSSSTPAPGLPLRRPGTMPFRKEVPLSTRNPERTRETILGYLRW